MNYRFRSWTLMLFFNEFVRAALYYVWIPLVMSHRFHIPIWWIGLCTSAHFISDATTKFFYGIAASWGYTRWIIRTGTGVAFLSIVVLVYTHSPATLLVFSILLGIGAASIWPAALAQFSQISEAGTGESLAKAFVPWMSGTGVGMFLPNTLLHLHHVIRLTFLLPSLVVVFCSWTIRSEPANGPLSFKREIQLLQILSRKIKAFVLPMVLQTFVIGTIVPFLALFGVRSLHLPPQKYALLLLAIGGVSVLLLIPFGKLADKLGQLPMLTVAFLIGSMSITLLSLSRSWQQALIPASIFGTSYAAVFPTWNAMFVDAVPHWLRTRAIGLLTAIEDSGTAAGPLLGAISWQFTGYSGPFAMSAIVMLILSVYFFVWWRHETIRSSVSN